MGGGLGGEEWLGGVGLKGAGQEVHKYVVKRDGGGR